jgi:hypothetical protein
MTGYSAVRLIRDGGSPSFLLIMGGLAVYLAGYFLVLLPWRARRIFRQQKSLQHPFRMIVDASGLSVSNEFGQAVVPWDHVRKWKENRQLFLVYHSDVLFHMIPKHCLRDPEEAIALRSLLSTHATRAAA